MQQRRQILHHVEGHVLVEMRINRPGADGGDDEGVAVGRRFDGDFHADVAARTAAIVDHHLLAETLTEFFAEHAALNVGGAAGDERHDKADGFIGIVVLRCDAAG